MKGFLTHYFLVLSWGETWFDDEEELLPQLIEHEDPEEIVWQADGGNIKLRFEDITAAMADEPTENFKAWARFCLIYAAEHNLENSAVLMQSMGCGSSDYLTVGKLIGYCNEFLD